MLEAGLWIVVSGAVAALLVLLTHACLKAVHPWLSKKALAQVNERSSHTTPTPQSAGLVMVPLIGLGMLWLAAIGVPMPSRSQSIVWMLAFVGLLAVGWLADQNALSSSKRLTIQAIMMVAVGAMLPPMDVVPLMPSVMEKILTIVAMLGVMNATNFIDGIDEITLSWQAPFWLGVLALSASGALAPWAASFALVILGACIGFWGWNRHPAKLFLGDAGSLPLGGATALMLAFIATEVSLALATLLAFFPLFDAASTLVRRAWQGKALAQAHREHRYQHEVHVLGRSPKVVCRDMLLKQGALNTLALILFYGDQTKGLWGLVFLILGYALLLDPRWKRP